MAMAAASSAYVAAWVRSKIPRLRARSRRLLDLQALPPGSTARRLRVTANASASSDSHSAASPTRASPLSTVDRARHDQRAVLARMVATRRQPRHRPSAADRQLDAGPHACRNVDHHLAHPYRRWCRRRDRGLLHQRHLVRHRRIEIARAKSPAPAWDRAATARCAGTPRAARRRRQQCAPDPPRRIRCHRPCWCAGADLLAARQTVSQRLEPFS